MCTTTLAKSVFVLLWCVGTSRHHSFNHLGNLGLSEKALITQCYHMSCATRGHMCLQVINGAANDHDDPRCCLCGSTCTLASLRKPTQPTSIPPHACNHCQHLPSPRATTLFTSHLQLLHREPHRVSSHSLHPNPLLSPSAVAPCFASPNRRGWRCVPNCCRIWATCLTRHSCSCTSPVFIRCIRCHTGWTRLDGIDQGWIGYS